MKAANENNKYFVQEDSVWFCLNLEHLRRKMDNNDIVHDIFLLNSKINKLEVKSLEKPEIPAICYIFVWMAFAVGLLLGMLF